MTGIIVNAPARRYVLATALLLAALVGGVSSSSDYRWVVCGRGFDGAGGIAECAEGDFKKVHKDTKHEVRCCLESSVAVAGWSSKCISTFWNKNLIKGRSKLANDVCYHDSTFEEASELCKAVGGRLCSKEEIQNQCTKGTGCGHDGDHTWACTENGKSGCTVSEDCCSGHCHADGTCQVQTPSPTKSPSQAPTSAPTSSLTKAPSDSPTASPSKSASPTVEPLLSYVFDNDCTAVPGYDPVTLACPGSTPLHRCEGDCDGDSQCGKGLRCHQRGSDSSIVPGCSGTPHTNKDYCVLPAPNELVYVFDNSASDSVNTTILQACQGDW